MKWAAKEPLSEKVRVDREFHPVWIMMGVLNGKRGAILRSILF